MLFDSARIAAVWIFALAFPVVTAFKERQIWEWICVKEKYINAAEILNKK